MKSRLLEIIRENDFDKDEVFSKMGEQSFFTAVISEISILEGYIEGAKKVIADLQEQIEKDKK